MKEQCTDERGFLGLVGAIRHGAYQHGWRDAVSAIGVAADKAATDEIMAGKARLLRPAAPGPAPQAAPKRGPKAPSHGARVLRLAMEARARALEADERQLELNDDVHAALGAITRAAATIPSK
jgi:hypothetical protein